MSVKEPEPRTAVMIMVEASWSDQSGTLHKCSATMENTSKSGARIRVRKPVQVGTKLKVQWRWEQFTGTSRYCRSEGRDYAVGIQKDSERDDTAANANTKAVRRAERENCVEPAPAAALSQLVTAVRKDTVIRPSETEVKLPASLAQRVSPTNVAQVRQETVASFIPPTSPTMIAITEKLVQRGTFERIRASKIGKAIEEKKPMRRKWFGLGHKDEEANDCPTITPELARDEAPATSPRAEEAGPEAQHGDERNGIELLSMSDIYHTAGIRGPRKAYSVNKIVEMLRSEHLRGLSKEMKRASILVALDASGISLEEVVEDAKARMEAIDFYEASQRSQFEAHLVRRAE